MKFIEVNGNLFKTEEYTSEEVVFAHCIASDFGMWGGIATQFILHFDMKNKLLNWSKSNGIVTSIRKSFHSTLIAGGYKVFTRPSLVGKAVKIDNVYNLITKEITNEYPTMEDLKYSLIHMCNQMTSNDDKVLAIPDMIGCGIDGLDRDEVVSLINDVFSDTDITVYAVKLS